MKIIELIKIINKHKPHTVIQTISHFSQTTVRAMPSLLDEVEAFAKALAGNPERELTLVEHFNLQCILHDERFQLNDRENNFMRVIRDSAGEYSHPHTYSVLKALNCQGLLNNECYAVVKNRPADAHALIPLLAKLNQHEMLNSTTRDFLQFIGFGFDILISMDPQERLMTIIELELSAQIWIGVLFEVMQNLHQRGLLTSILRDKDAAEIIVAAMQLKNVKIAYQQVDLENQTLRKSLDYLTEGKSLNQSHFEALKSFSSAELCQFNLRLGWLRKVQELNADNISHLLQQHLSKSETQVIALQLHGLYKPLTPTNLPTAQIIQREPAPGL